MIKIDLQTKYFTDIIFPICLNLSIKWSFFLLSWVNDIKFVYTTFMTDNHLISPRLIVDNLLDSIIVLDTNFIVIDLNDAAETMFLTSRKTALQKQSRNFLPEEIESVAKMALQNERPYTGDEMNALIRNGAAIFVQPHSNPIFSPEGTILGVILQIKDLRAAKFLSEKNTQLSDTLNLEQLLSGLLHELRNPLSGIRGAAQIAQNSDSDNEKSRCADIIIKEVDRLSELLDTFKRLEPLPQDTFKPIDINEIIKEIKYLESKSKDNTNIYINLNLDVTLPHIDGDMNSLKQVILNLIKNSTQALNNSGSVNITTRWINDYKLDGKNVISIDIDDNGPGIPLDQLPKIFKPFYTTKKHGSGLGLFIAYQIIAKHGGSIMVDSRVGAGTTFHIYLPV